MRRKYSMAVLQDRDKLKTHDEEELNDIRDHIRTI